MNALTLETLVREHESRRSRRRPVTQQQLIHAVQRITDEAQRREADGRATLSVSTLLRGMSAIKHHPIAPSSAENDARYVLRSLDTDTATGSFLVPVETAATILSQLADVATARASGATVWPMAGIEELKVPVGVTSPTFEWVPQNSRQVASDPTFGEIDLALKNCQSMQRWSAQLFRTTSAALDILLEKFLAVGMAEAEDGALHAAATLTDAPTALLAKSGIGSALVGGSANGGALARTDIRALILAAGTAKMPLPWAFFCSPRTFDRLVALDDSSSRPWLTPSSASAPPASRYELLGHPVFVTNEISNTEANGSSTGQSHIVLAHPASIHVGESGTIMLAIASDFADAYEKNQIGLRVGHQVAFDYAPPASIQVLRGVN